MGRQAEWIISLLTTVGIVAFFVLNAPSVTTLLTGFVSQANSYTSNIAHLGNTGGT